MKKIISFILATIMLLGMFSIGTFAETPLALDIQAVEGASVRIGTVAGIRFQTKINRAQLKAIVDENGEANVEIGTLIAPTQYVQGAGGFTMEKLDKYKATYRLSNDAYVKVVATYGSPFKTDGDYDIYAGSLENILDKNVTLAFSGIGYVKVGDEVVYAEYNEFNSSRTVGYVAYRAYLDKDSGLDSDDKTLIDDFANKFLVTKLGEGAPKISTIRYFETFDDKAACEYKNATSLLKCGEKDYWQAANYKMNTAKTRSDIEAKYTEDGTLRFKAPDNGVAYVKGNGESVINSSAFLKIPNLTEVMYAKGETHLVMQFDLKILNAGSSDFGMGVAYCADDDINFARAIPILKSNYKMLIYLNDKTAGNMVYTGGWAKSLGCDFSANTVNVRFEWTLGDPAGEIYIKGNELTDYGSWGSGNKYAVEECNLGLYFLGSGEYEIDNLLVYSYGDGGYLQ